LVLGSRFDDAVLIWMASTACACPPARLAPGRARRCRLSGRASAARAAAVRNARLCSTTGTGTWEPGNPNPGTRTC